MMMMVSACSSIPTAGPVATIEATVDADRPTRYEANPLPPADGASASAVLRGFLRAGLGVADNYGVARQYLTTALSQTWQPEEKITVYRSDWVINSTPADDELQLQLEVAAYVDASGIRRDVPAGTSESLTVKMEEVDGEWRVADIPDGIMISTVDAANLLQSRALYFYNSSYEFWVPDIRWFVNRQGIATNIVQALIDGPAPYLQGAVISAFPENTALAVESVPIESGTATVDFTAEILESADELRRQQMEQQLRVTLTELNDVNSVNLRSGPVSLADGNEELAVIKDPSVGSEQIVIAENELALLEGGQLGEIPDVPSIAALEPVDPATSYDRQNFAFLDSDRANLYATGTAGQAVRPVFGGSNLTAPSYDPANWIWTASTEGGSSSIRAIPPGGAADEAVTVLAPWLGSRVISEIRVSRDGARALIVAQQSGDSQVLLAGISRSEQGRPQALGEPIALDVPGPVNTAKWVTETTVVVANTSSDDPVVATLIPFAAEPVQFDPPIDEAAQAIEHLSAGYGRTEIFAQSSTSIWQLVGNTWTEQNVEARDPAFPG